MKSGAQGLLRVLTVVAVATAGAAAGVQDFKDVQDANAGEILKRSRQAVGGDSVGRIESLRLTGTSQIQSDNGLIACDVEIRILLPDHYLRIDTSPFGEKRGGFSGKTVLSAIKELGRTTYPPDKLKDQVLLSERVRMLQLLLGAATYAPSKIGVAFRSVAGGMNTFQAQGTAEEGAQRRAKQAWEASGNAGQAPGTRSASPTFSSNYPDQYSVDVTLREDARFRIIFERDTYLPARVTYPSATGDEVIVAFAERRVTGGLNLPYLVTTTAHGRVIDNLILNEIEVNPGLTKADFER